MQALQVGRTHANHVASNMVSLFTFLAFIHIIVFHQLQMLEQEAFPALQVLVTSFFSENAVFEGLDDIRMSPELETGAVQYEHLHNAFALQQTVL